MNRLAGFLTKCWLITTFLFVILNAHASPSANPGSGILIPQDLPRSSFIKPDPNLALGSAPLGLGIVIQNDPAFPETTPAVAYNPFRREYLVVWSNDRAGNDDIQARRLSWNGAPVGPDFYVSAGAGAERSQPAVAYNSQNDKYLVVWQHFDGLYYRIYGRLIDGNGMPLLTEFPISSGPALKNCFRPRVSYASLANSFMVVWERHGSAAVSSDIEGQLITGSGTSDGTNFYAAIGDNNYSHGQPNLTYNSRINQYLIVFERLDKNAGLYDVIGQLLPPASGIVILSPIEFARYTVSSTKPAVAALPSVGAHGIFLVAWELQYAPADKDIMGRTMTGDQTLGSVFYINGDAQVNSTNPALSANSPGEEILAIWTQPYTVSTLNLFGIFGRVVSGTGTFKGPEKWIWGFLSGVSGLAAGPPGDYLIAYEEYDLGIFSQGIWGALWGNRLYLPLILKP